MPTILSKTWGGALAAACLLAGCTLAAPAPATQPAAPVGVAPNPVQAVVLPTITPEAADAAALAPATSLTPAQQALLATLKNHGPAPEVLNESWLNSAPLKLADLRGKVVMLEFWTFG